MEQELTGGAVSPIYIVIDESSSMKPYGIEAVNGVLPDIHRIIARDPFVAERCQVGIISFSDTAEELLPLSNLTNISEIPGCTAKGSPVYSEAFKLLLSVISRDVAKFKSHGVSVFRPWVFFITGSNPTDDWEASHRALIDKNVNPQAPHIIAFGVADANPEVISKIGISGAFIAQENVNIFTVFQELLAGLTGMRMSLFRRLDGA